MLLSIKCGGCSDCGPLRPFEYGIINSLNETLDVEFYGNNESGSIINIYTIKLVPNDTSDLWVTVIDPASSLDFDHFFTNYFEPRSFPFDTDSVIIKSDDVLVSTFRRRNDERNQDYTSIFFGGAFIRSNQASDFYEINPTFFMLDSVNLKLK